MRSPILIYSPNLDQSQAIARILKRAVPSRHLIALTMPGEANPALLGPFDEIVDLADADLDSTSLHIPTGSRSTALMLQDGDVTLGSVTMSRDALRFYDKSWSLETASRAGVPIPRTWHDLRDIPGFPVFYKSSEEGGGMRGVARHRDEVPRSTSGLIFQEFIESPGTYGVGFVAMDGIMRACHIHYESESYPEIGGSAIIVERKTDARLAGYAEALLRQTGFSGWGLIEFKYCPIRNDYVFMEVNAKFWASCEFAFRNEPNFTRLLFDSEPVGDPCARMAFMDRALRRGPRFLASILPGLLPGSGVRFAPGLWRHVLANLPMPERISAALRGRRSK